MTDTPEGPRTWESTMRLWWKRRYGQTGFSLDTHQLQQRWRCLETHETEWRPIEVEQ